MTDMDTANLPLVPALQENITQIRTELGDPADLVVRKLRLAWAEGLLSAVVFIDGLVDTDVIDNFVMRSLTQSGQAGLGGDPAVILDCIRESAISVADVKVVKGLESVLEGLLNGGTAILVNGTCLALIASTVGWKTRQIPEATLENVVRGSREAFSEDLASNVSAVRRRIRHPRLRVEKRTLGELTRTHVAILHIEGVAKAEVVREVHDRLSRIKIDGVLEGSYIEELIEDNRLSPFPQIEHTERPDKVAASLLEGRLAVITDGSPSVLLIPVGLPQLLQASEDYYERFPYAIPIRLLRAIALLISIYLPAMYVATITYHQEMIPLGLALNIAGSREGAPWPAFVETLIMEVMFEILREAGLRLPRPVGQAVSIVGGLVIGDSAVRAGLAAPPTVIVVAATGIASFSIPSFSTSIVMRVLRFPVLVVGAVTGLPGITLSGMMLLFHLVSLRSFGVPYLTPLSPVDFSSLKDTFARVPWWAMRRLPLETAATPVRSGSLPSRRRRRKEEK